MRRLLLSVWVGLIVTAVACGAGNPGAGGREGAATPAIAAARSPTERAVAAAATASPTPAPRGVLTVFAASSLTDAFGELGAAFSQAHPGVTVRFNFAASSALRTQLEQGARADLFASADQPTMDAARKGGVIDGEDRLFAKNRLVLIYPTGNPGKVATLQDLAKPGLRLVLTSPSVPIGNYARQALDKMNGDPAFGPDFSKQVLANLKSEEANVRAVVAKVQLGEADAAIVYATDVTPSNSKDIQMLVIPDAFNTIATYPLAVVNEAPNAAAARAFIAFVRSPRGQEVLKKWNFIVDAGTGS